MSPVHVLQMSPVHVLQMSSVHVLQMSPVQVLQMSPVHVLQMVQSMFYKWVQSRFYKWVQSMFYKWVQSRFYKSSPVQLLQHAFELLYLENLSYTISITGLLYLWINVSKCFNPKKWAKFSFSLFSSWTDAQNGLLTFMIWHKNTPILNWLNRDWCTEITRLIIK